MVKPDKSVGRRRLMALHDDVRERSRRKAWRRFFDMSAWVHTTFKGRYAWPNNNGEVEVNNECGTAACLLGHGVNVPMLRRAGLRAIKPLRDDHPVLAIPGKNIWGGRSAQGADQICTELFGISSTRTRQIFVNELDCVHLSAVTPQKALANLRKVVKEIDKYEGWTK